MRDEKCCCCVGPQGPQGIQGFQGSQGIQGQQGQDGLSGPMGPQGLQGTSGPQGQDGPKGDQGIPGSSGLQGPAGLKGDQGSAGPMGPQGMPGAQGPQGIQGVPGKDCDKDDCCCPEWCNVFASVAQTVGPYLAPNDMVLFDKQNQVVVSGFDLSQMGISGDVKFLKHGIYHIAWQLQARVVPPIPAPVPSWSFGLWLNGVLVQGSIYSGFTQSPGDDACHSTGDVIIEVNAGDTLRLRNTSVSAVNLNPNITGSVFPITIASLNIECLQSLI